MDAIKRGARAAVFIDVDNTLVRRLEGPGSELVNVGGRCPAPTEGVKRAIRALADAGHYCFWCTGRPFDGLNEEVRALPYAGRVSMAGAKAVLGERILFEHYMPRERLIELLRFFEQMPPCATIEMDAESVAFGPDCSYRPNIRPFASFEEFEAAFPDLPVGKICMEPEVAAVLAQRPEVLRNYHLVDTGGNIWETTPPGTSKSVGVAAILEALGEEVISIGIGDSENDLPLFEAVDLRVAMGNAMPDLKDHADLVVADVEHDGVADALTRLGLI